MMLALTVLCIFLSGVLEFNTLFLLGLASFTVGIVIREFDIKFGVAYLAAAVLLGFVLSPNKLYCFTFLAMGAYVLITELLWPLMKKLSLKFRVNLKVCLWICKFVVFNAIYLPILFLFPKLLFAGDLDSRLIVVALIVGQIVLVIYDLAYDYFQRRIWGKYRKLLLGIK